MEDNNIIRKFYCDNCGDIIEQDYILLMTRCDKCSLKPLNRYDKYNKVKIVSNKKENKNLREK